MRSHAHKMELMNSWYRSKMEWIEFAPRYELHKLLKRQRKELIGVCDEIKEVEAELKNDEDLTPVQIDYRELRLIRLKAHELLAMDLISKLEENL